MANPRAALIAQMARARGLDPAAVDAIVSVEGGFNGSIGDHGTSFGPFQMHEGGALPRGIRNPQQWANSRQGIAYALDHINSVAHGLHGQQAISAISSRFERPADVPGEIAKASSRYGQFGGAALKRLSESGITGAATAVPSPAPGAGLVGQSLGSMMAAQLLQQSQDSLNGQAPDPSSLLALTVARQALGAAQSTFGPAQQVQTAGDATLPPPANGVVAAARSMLGTPYVWGGNTPGKALDCSGFLQQAYAKIGIHIPRTTYDQIKAGQPVGLHQLAPGDAVFTEPGHAGPNHVGMYIGHGMVQESPHTGDVNKVIPLKDFIAGGFVGARRFTR